MASGPMAQNMLGSAFVGGQISDTDPDVGVALEAEPGRQADKLDQIASGNIVSKGLTGTRAGQLPGDAAATRG